MFQAERTYDMSSFGWEGCTFTFKALSFDEQQDLDELRVKQFSANDKKELQEAATEILGVMQRQFIRGQALDENGQKVDVKAEDFITQIPFDVLLKLTALVTGSEVNEDFLVKSMKPSKTEQTLPQS